MSVAGAYVLGAAGQVASGKLLRLALGAAFRPSTGVAAVSGMLAGPANTQGELTLLSNVALTVQAFRAVIQNTTDATAGQYVVPNDAAVTLGAGQGFPAQDASQFRRAYVVTYVDDAQVTGSGANSAYLTILGGPLAASAAAATYPAVPNNALLLGELLIPPTGQTVTLTPYNPRTTTRGGILPVVVDGSTTIAGHDGVPPAFDGQYRSHPSRGLQRGAGSVWDDPVGLETLAWAATSTATWLTAFPAAPLKAFREGRHIRLEGSVTHSTPGFSAGAGAEFAIIQMPAGTAPAVQQIFVCYCWAAPNNTYIYIKVRTDGQVTFTSPVALGTGMSIDLSGCQWLAGL